ncbi:MAG: nuclear transport factor 2 family protein [Mycobacterium sp.]|nr:nuclear transport factor 2 family protein [Mycobacterium sp.]
MTDLSGSQPTARELLDRAQRLFLDKDLEAFAELFAADGVHELPFAPPGVPVTIRGRDGIRGYFATISTTPIEFEEFTELTVHQSVDPEVVIAEYQAIGTITSTGAPYRARYIQVLHARNGEITLWRDYWNPLSGAQALGRLPQLFQALTGSHPS